MNLEKLYDDIESTLLEYSKFGYIQFSPQLIGSMEVELVARLFVLSLSDLTNSKIMHNNILNEYSKKYTSENSAKDYDAGLQTLRRFEKKLRLGHENNLKYYEQQNIPTPPKKDLISRREGRLYDYANLELIFSPLNASSKELFLYFIKNMLTDSKKLSDRKFSEAYDAFDLGYKIAKECDDKIQYIIKWVDLYRMESKLHFSLIPKIADYMSTHKNMPLDHSPIFWGNPPGENSNMDAYQILRYENYINYFEYDCTENMASYVLKERHASACICNKYLKQASETFRPFFEGKADAIDIMYHFCHDIYPVIELHCPSNFYLFDGKQLNRPKIKCARKIINYLLCPEKISTFYNKQVTE